MAQNECFPSTVNLMLLMTGSIVKKGQILQLTYIEISFHLDYYNILVRWNVLCLKHSQICMQMCRYMFCSEDISAVKITIGLKCDHLLYHTIGLVQIQFPYSSQQFKGHAHASIMYQVSGKNSQPYEVNIMRGCCGSIGLLFGSVHGPLGPATWRAHALVQLRSSIAYW